MDDEFLDQDEAIDMLVHYALALEIISQVYLEAASNIAQKDKSRFILSALKEDRVFINAYKKTMAQEPIKAYKKSYKKIRFYMKGADA